MSDKNGSGNRITTRTVAVVGLLSALSLVFAFLESLLPGLPFMPPGAKLGLSNIVTMFTGWLLGVPYAIFIAVIKAGFAFTTRGASAGFMSLAGGLLSALATSLMLRTKKPLFGCIGIGAVGGVCHNIGQLIAAMIVTSPYIISYIPVLIFAGIITGCITGVTLYYVIKAISGAKLTERFYKGNV